MKRWKLFSIAVLAVLSLIACGLVTAPTQAIAATTTPKIAATASCDSNYNYSKYEFKDRHDGYWSLFWQAGNWIMGDDSQTTPWCVYFLPQIGSNVWAILDPGTWDCWTFSATYDDIELHSCGTNFSTIKSSQEWALENLQNGTDYTYEWESFYNGDVANSTGLDVAYNLRGYNPTLTTEEMDLVGWT